MVHIRYYLLLIIVLIKTLSSVAQYNFQCYTTKDGLPNNFINYIYKDSFGFIWLATPNGLACYDGYKFKNFYNIPGDSKSLPNNNVTGITEDKNGNIWLGLWGGVALYNRKSNQFKALKLAFENDFDAVQHIFCDSKNRIWVATWLGHYLFDVNGKQIKHWRGGNKINDLPHDRTGYTTEDKFGAIWVGSHGGLCKLNEKDLTFKVYKDDNSVYTKNNEWLNDVMKIHFDDRGKVWFGGWANGLKSMNIKSGHFQSYLHYPEFAGYGAYNVVGDMAFFDEKFWIGTHDKGLGFFDTTQYNFTFLKDLGLENPVSPTKKINCMLVTDNILWIGGANGLYKLDKRKQFLEVYKLNGIKSGSCLPDITDIIKSREKKNELLISTWTCGLFKYNLDSRTVSKYEDETIDSHNDNLRIHIRKLNYTKDSTLLIASSHGLFYKKKNEKIARAIRPLGKQYALVNPNYFFSVDENIDGVIWAASANGILKIDPQTFNYKFIKISEISPEMENKLSDNIIDFTISENGNIYFLRGNGHESQNYGITEYNFITKKFTTHEFGEGKLKNYPFPKFASKIKAASNKYLFVTSARGLTIIDLEDFKHFFVLNSFHKLVADNCNKIIKDNFGNIWIASSEGISFINMVKKEIKSFSQFEGFPNIEVSSISFVDSNYVGVGFNSDWFVLLNTSKVMEMQKNKNSLRFSSFKSNSKFQEISDSIILNKDCNYFSFNFSPLNFLPEKENIFKVQIQDIDGKSSYTTNSNEISFSNIKSGALKIIVYDNWGNSGKITIYKPPYFYELTYVKIIFLVIIIFIIVFLFLKIQKQQLIKAEKSKTMQFMLSEYEMKALRSQINTHFIYNALNGINRFIYDRMPDKASSYLSKFANLLRITVEHTRSSWVDLDQELNAIQMFIDLESLNQNEPINFLIEASPEVDLKKTLIPPMLLQPLVENALKHSGGLNSAEFKMGIFISLINSNLSISVIDNGPSILDRGASFKNDGLSLATKIIRERLSILNHQENSTSYFEVFQEPTIFGLSTISKLMIPFKNHFE
jgi:ligand-binding sensor domain-containing protein/sensor histidine kinase YesM